MSGCRVLCVLVAMVCAVGYLRMFTYIAYTDNDDNAQSSAFLMQSRTTPGSQSRGVLLYNTGYRVAHRTVRLIGIRECSDKRSVWTVYPIIRAVARLYGPQCPWAVNPQCRWMSVYYDLHLHPNTDLDKLPSSFTTLSSSQSSTQTNNVNQTFLRITTQTKGRKATSKSVQIGRLIDARPNLEARTHLRRGKQKRRQHKLAVCVQPMYLYADWRQLVQFIELWSLQGATKFYIYWQSVTAEVDQVLRVYESTQQWTQGNTSAVQIQRLAWPTLPEASGADSQVYRTEVLAAINDCALRARSEADWVAFVDLDELVVAFDHSTVVDWLYSLHIHTHVLLVLSSNVHINITHNLEGQSSKQNISDVSMSHLYDVERETYIYSPGIRSKVIAKPDVLLRMHVHTVLQTTGPIHKLHYVENSTALVYHLRRVRSTIHPKRMELLADDSLKPWAISAETRWPMRVAHYEQHYGSIALIRDRGLASMENTDECLTHLYKSNSKHCMSVSACEHNLTAINNEQWIKAQSTDNAQPIWHWLTY